MFPACLLSYREKLRQTQLRGKRRQGFSPAHSVAPFPSNIQLTKNKWVHHLITEVRTHLF